MLLFLTGGIVALYFRRSNLVIVQFLACIALCEFLHKAQADTFAYAQPSHTSRINVAHLLLNDNRSRQAFESEISLLDANLVSIQTNGDSAYLAHLQTRLATRYRHQHLLKNNKSHTLVVSSYPIRYLDTVLTGAEPTLAGKIWIDSLYGELNFICTQLHEDETRTEPQAQLADLSHYLQSNFNHQPLLTLSCTHLASWTPEMRSFRHQHTLNDSRFDWNWQNSPTHIFYSRELECTGFQTILNGNGVLGSYQFRNTSHHRTHGFTQKT